MIGIVNKHVIRFYGGRAQRQLVSNRSRVYERRYFLFGKRVADILFSLFIIIFLLSWLLPLLAILIKLDSRGPVFFLQERVGFLGKKFRCIKLRTMIVNSSSDKQQAISDDPRITRLGKFLRISSVDEFPQFFNVLMGHMSCVGPRPHMIADNAAFGSVIRNYRLRHFMKPGITGMAQVRGFRGPAKDIDSIFQRFQWDAFYIRHADAWLDFKILRQTTLQILRSVASLKGKEDHHEIQTSFFQGAISTE